MARDHDDYEDREPPRPRKSSDSSVVIVLLAITGIMVLGCGGLVAPFFFGWAATNVKVQPVEVRPGEVGPAEVMGRQTYPRDTFTKLVGKTTEQVTAAVGRPNTTSDFGDGGSVWVYTDSATDPATGNTGNVQVWFDGGKVTKVAFP